ncbi:hypothetical protein ZHAS_00004215 [Anopheles sinensis]|uniref:Uncharacterized protein n=1 Tax=Anopheles sinensis TaxID=74873 RepID=A0A084VGD9_ANOSI|nr:hypothetical protein ZHAS_00004215 [Anopheles sinensis]
MNWVEFSNRASDRETDGLLKGREKTQSVTQFGSPDRGKGVQKWSSVEGSFDRCDSNTGDQIGPVESPSYQLKTWFRFREQKGNGSTQLRRHFCGVWREWDQVKSRRWNG